MMNKNCFCDKIHAIEDNMNYADQASKFLSDEVVEKLLSIGDKILDCLNAEFCPNSNDIFGTDIDYYLFEVPSGVEMYDNHNQVIDTPEKLYDYLVENLNATH